MTDLMKLTQQMRQDSEAWFPELHERSHWDLVIAYTLGLAGEAGETANEIKKWNRDGAPSQPANLGAELADVLIYLLLLADECGIDIEAAYRKKREVNRGRWEHVVKWVKDLEPGDEVPGSGTVVRIQEAGWDRWCVTFDLEGHPGSIPHDAPAWEPSCNVWRRWFGKDDRLSVCPTRKPWEVRDD